MAHKTQNTSAPDKATASRDTVFEAVGFLALYDRILTAADVATQTPAYTPGSGAETVSGFVDPAEQEKIELYSWSPIGRLPRPLVGPMDNSNIRLYRLDDDNVILGVRAGGGIPKGQQKAQTGTEHVLTVIVNGRFDLDVSLTYNGLDGWQYVPLCLPAEFDPADPRGCEIEKDGRLLYSGALGATGTTAMADRANLVRFYANGTIEGWASARNHPETDVFVTVHAAGESTLLPASDQWVNSDLKKFQFGIQAEAQTLYPIHVTMDQGIAAARSPAWGCHDGGCGFLLSNPRRQDDDILLTIVSQSDKKFAITALRALADGTHFPTSEADDAAYRYYDGHNTARIPARLFQDEPTLTVLGGPDGATLGMLPPLAPLLDGL